AARIAHQSQLEPEGEQRTVGHGVPAEQGALAAGGERSGAGADPAGGIGAADPYVTGAGRGEPGLRSERSPDDADVADRAEVFEVDGSRANDSRRRRAHPG